MLYAIGGWVGGWVGGWFTWRRREVRLMVERRARSRASWWRRKVRISWRRYSSWRTRRVGGRRLVFE